MVLTISSLTPRSISLVSHTVNVSQPGRGVGVEVGVGVGVGVGGALKQSANIVTPVNSPFAFSFLTAHLHLLPSGISHGPGTGVVKGPPIPVVSQCVKVSQGEPDGGVVDGVGAGQSFTLFNIKQEDTPLE